MKITIHILIIALTILSCNSNTRENKISSRVVPDSDIIERLKGQKAEIDTFYKKNREKLVVYAIVEGDEIPRKIVNEDFPENIKTTFNLLFDSTDKLLTVSEYPFSQSGDWHIALTHYFDDDEKTFAFERQTNFFNSICTDIAFETVTEFYNSEFKRIDSLYKLTDQNKVELNRDSCQIPYDYEYSVKENANELLMKAKIKNGR